MPDCSEANVLILLLLWHCSVMVASLLGMQLMLKHIRVAGIPSDGANQHLPSYFWKAVCLLTIAVTFDLNI